MWVRRNEPAAFARTTRLMSSKDYLVFRLTGRHVMDVGSAAATLMFERRPPPMGAGSRRVRADWRPGAMAPIHAALDIVGTVNEAAAEALGLRPGIPVIAGTPGFGGRTDRLAGCSAPRTAA